MGHGAEKADLREPSDVGIGDGKAGATMGEPSDVGNGAGQPVELGIGSGGGKPGAPVVEQSYVGNGAGQSVEPSDVGSGGAQPGAQLAEPSAVGNGAEQPAGNGAEQLIDFLHGGSSEARPTILIEDSQPLSPEIPPAQPQHSPAGSVASRLQDLTLPGGPPK